MLAVALLLACVAAPAPPEGALAAARALVDAGKPQEALARLASEDAADPRVAHLLGLAHYHAGDSAKAIATLAPIEAALPAW